MSDVRTDEEQAELVKKWWRENGRNLFLTVVVVLAAWFSWDAYQNHQRQTREQASAMYSQLALKVAEAAGSESEQDKTQVQVIAQELIETFDGSIYADFARFISAGVAIEKKDYPAAATLLREVVDHAEEGPVKYSAILRLANVLTQNKQYDAALEALEMPIASDAYQAQLQETLGDVMYLRGQKSDALAAYKKALEAAQKHNQNPGLLQRKVDTLQSQLAPSA